MHKNNRPDDTPSEQEPVRVFAPAKINLTLGVIRKRADSYHDIFSLVAFADIGDEIEIAPADDFSFRVSGPFAGDFAATETDPSPGGKNLAVRAAHGYAALAGVPAHCAIHLRKNLPLASGLGGGSADAAAVIRGLRALWKTEPPERALQAFLRELGADVPACHAGRTLFMGGTGDVMFPAPALAEFFVVLVNPGIPCPTGPVFSAFKGPWSVQESSPENLPRTKAGWISFFTQTGNTLQRGACALVPEIEQVLALLQAQSDCLYAAMSGSGATCFALFAAHEAAQNAAASVRAQRPEWWVAAGRLLP